MDPTLHAVLGVLMRWVHITSVVILIGSAYYVHRAGTAFAPRFRTTVYTAVGAVFVSGLYNFLTKASYPPGYHMWFGIKVLLALHVLAALVLAARHETTSAKLQRSLRILLLSATAVIVISNYLRWISLSPVVKLP
jgi:uncharacterized membrane protein